MNFQNKKIQKLISALVIAAVLSPALSAFVKPPKAEAQFHDVIVGIWTGLTSVFTSVGAASQTTSTAISIANVAKEVTRQLVMVVARRALAEMTKSTVNWINNGFHGSPLFVQNPKSFFKDITKTEIKNLINTVGYDSVRFPFGKQFALSTIDSYKRQFEENASYSLSRVTNDPVLLYNYQNNFSYGGWNGFLLNTQYPQNNAIGFRMQLNDQLASKLVGTEQNAAQKVNTTLQQGMGFLSPQTCPSNPNYNNLQNEFQKPTFKFTAPDNLVAPTPAGITSTGLIVDQAAYDAYKQKKALYDSQYLSQKGIAQAAWAAKNVCPGGLVNTTPGSVVSSQITKALGLPQDQASLGAALGNSLSAVFDTLLNKFLGSGLTSLASTSNSYTPPDDFDYLGNTLGSPSDNVNGGSDVFGGPDEEIVLSKFNEAVATGIADTKEELSLLDNSDPNNLGTTQMFSLIWPKARELDICLPGPDFGWEDRLQAEMERNSQKLQEKSSDTDGDTAYLASSTFKELKYAVDSFKDWIKTKMMRELPDGIIFMDAVKNIGVLDQQYKELTDNRREKAQALARLQAIQSSLAHFTTQPVAGSQEEKDLITIRKQYNALFDSIANSNTIERARTELDSAKDQFGNLQKLVGQCTSERKAAGWTIPSTGWTEPVGDTSILTAAVGKPYTAVFGGPGDFPQDYRFQPYTTDGREKEQFCQLPIASGFTHEPFVSLPNMILYPRLLYADLPLVNGKDVFRFQGSGFLGTGIGKKTHHVDIAISCNTVYFSHLLDYKGSIPSTVNIVDPPPLPDDTGELGPNTGTIINNGSNNPPNSCGGVGQLPCS